MEHEGWSIPAAAWSRCRWSFPRAVEAPDPPSRHHSGPFPVAGSAGRRRPDRDALPSHAPSRPSLPPRGRATLALASPHVSQSRPRRALRVSDAGVWCRARPPLACGTKRRCLTPKITPSPAPRQPQHRGCREMRAFRTGKRCRHCSACPPSRF